MREIATGIAKTALLSGGLGLLLYLVFAALAQMPELMVSLLATVGSGAMVALILQEMAFALRTGIVPRLPIAIRRGREPVWFWGSLAFGSACLCLLVPLQLWSALRLLAFLTGWP